MKKLLFALFFLTAVVSSAQPSKDSPAYSRPHKVVIQLASEDTLVHKALMKQINNVVTVSPESQVEIVCHGPGLSILMQNKTIVREKIAKFNAEKVKFVACEFSMKERNITKEAMITEAGFVPYGILELVSKQEDGWSYIKTGF